MIERIQNDNGTSLVLTPNRSLSWQGNLILWCAFSLVVLVVALGMALAGAWVILPFAGLELMGLLAALYYTSRECHRQEVLHVSSDTVRVEKGLYQKEQEWEMPRQWVRLYLTMPMRGWKPPRLQLVHRDTEVTFASFLNQEDTKALVAFLESKGIHIERQRPHQIVWF